MSARDKEMQALQKICALVEDLTPEQAHRVLRFVGERHQERLDGNFGSDSDDVRTGDV